MEIEIINVRLKMLSKQSQTTQSLR